MVAKLEVTNQHPSLPWNFMTKPGTIPITIFAVNSDHGLSFAGEETRTMLSEFPFLYRFTVLLNSGGSNSPWSEFWSEFPHFSEGAERGAGVKGAGGRRLSHFSFCCAFRCCVVYSPCFPVWGEEKVMTIYDAGPLAAGPLCGLLNFMGMGVVPAPSNFMTHGFLDPLRIS